MSLDIAAVQGALRAEGLDGWLWYDFHGSNPIAQRLAGLDGTGHMTTRRWFYLVPASGEPRALVHAIERHNLDALPGSKITYASRVELESGLKTLVSGLHRVAMEYSPFNAIPYVSRVDAGTVEAVRALGVDVVSSGDLVQQFEAVWDARAVQTHRVASDALYRVKDRAFDLIRQRIHDRTPTTEYDVQQLMARWFVDEGLVTDSAPVVAAQENAGNPHYLPPPTGSRAIHPDELVLLDLWGKRDQAGAVFADITWVGFTGRVVPGDMVRAFDAIARARDAAVELVQRSVRAGHPIHGYELDQAARQVIEQAGYARHILHRTGHSLGESVHGNGVHLDDYETHDDRRLMPGCGFTIEPGLYFPTFGVRTEINVVWYEGEARITGPVQTAIVPLG